MAVQRRCESATCTQVAKRQSRGSISSSKDLRVRDDYNERRTPAPDSREGPRAPRDRLAKGAREPVHPASTSGREPLAKTKEHGRPSWLRKGEAVRPPSAGAAAGSGHRSWAEAVALQHKERARIPENVDIVARVPEGLVASARDAASAVCSAQQGPSAQAPGLLALTRAFLCCKSVLQCQVLANELCEPRLARALVRLLASGDVFLPR